jgi:hypothetical protein
MLRNYLSLIISALIFSIIQYLEYKKYSKKNKKYNLLNLSNFGIFILIYILTTIVIFLLIEGKNINKVQKNIELKEINIKDNLEIDTNILKKIPDNINTGFTPYSENT